MNIDNITNINNIIINRIIVHVSIKYCFFKLLTAKSFEVFPKRNGYGFISELFALN